MVAPRRAALTRVAAAAFMIVGALAPTISGAQADDDGDGIAIPERVNGAARAVTIADLASIRDIDSLCLSPDASQFAILVRQGDPSANAYRTAWFVGNVTGGRLVPVGDGGEARLMTLPVVGQTGDWSASACRFSPDGRWIAYTAQRDGEIQLWKSRIDGRGQRRLTRNAADVTDFFWTNDSRRLLFSVGVMRETRDARASEHARQGYLLQDFHVLFRAINPGSPASPPETERRIWRVDANGAHERPGDAAETDQFARLQRLASGTINGADFDPRSFSAALAPPVQGADGSAAWLERSDPAQDGILPFARLMARLGEDRASIACEADVCVGQVFRKIWWSHDGNEILFWRIDGPTDLYHSLYAWSPTSGRVRTIVSSPAHMLRDCQIGSTSIICLRETPLEPRHVAAIDIETGEISRIGDVNPEFSQFNLGHVERIEWETPPDVAERGYAPRAGGFILYPPGYDPSRTYPVFVAPYTAGGFLRGDVGDEQPLLVYAANGFIVVNTAFPHAIRASAYGDAAARIARAYDPALNYPHLSMLAESTFRALDLAAARASTDRQRVGIGGVSHGAFVPLYMTQLRDRFAALSVAHGSWNQSEYYMSRLPFPYGENPAPLWPEDAQFWAPIDLAQHLDTIEAPILFHFSDREVTGAASLVRRMSDAHLAFEAFSFPNELHLKWQPAHRLAIYNRNLDWFRFWLQDIEDPDPAKAEQYERWRQLRDLQCRNPRSLRNYCSVVSTRISPAQNSSPAT